LVAGLGHFLYNAYMLYKKLPDRFEKLEEELERLEHPLHDELHWLLGVASALYAVLELSSAPPDVEYEFEDFDS
jgi:hypothetical protein